MGARRGRRFLSLSPSRRDLTGGYVGRLPVRRPRGLALRTVRRRWYRVDATAPRGWDWAPLTEPRHRFDSASGSYRVRYAASSARAALRERFDAEGRIISAAALRSLRLVELTGAARLVDLRREANLDALGLDDQVNTSRSPGVWEACQQLGDLFVEWYGERIAGIAYRSRTTPATSVNVAFFSHAPLVAEDRGPLREQRRLLDALVVADGFAIEGLDQ